MSYDLYFFGRKLTPEEFSGYFSSRLHYKVNGSQAFYQNEDTGVYFNFDRNIAEEKLDSEAPDYDVSFNLNYFRPHIFGLEAEPELRALVDAFDLTVHDPQNGGMGTGAYSKDGFLKGWNRGNEFGYRAILKNPKTDLATLSTYPTWHIEQIWKWNFNRDMVQRQLGESTFVPKVSFLRKEGRPASAAVWPDAIAALIPEVDLLIIPRRELAPWTLFQKKEDRCLIGFSEVSKLLGPYLSNNYNMPSFLLPHSDSPKAIRDFVRGLNPFTGNIEGISVDKVLDQELVDRNK